MLFIWAEYCVNHMLPFRPISFISPQLLGICVLWLFPNVVYCSCFKPLVLRTSCPGAGGSPSGGRSITWQYRSTMTRVTRGGSVSLAAMSCDMLGLLELLAISLLHFFCFCDHQLFVFMWSLCVWRLGLRWFRWNPVCFQWLLLQRNWGGINNPTGKIVALSMIHAFKWTWLVKILNSVLA